MDIASYGDGYETARRAIADILVGLKERMSDRESSKLLDEALDQVYAMKAAIFVKPKEDDPSNQKFSDAIDSGAPGLI